MADKYTSFGHLAMSEQENVDFRVRCHATASSTAIIAPHGGAIEPGTSEIAHAVAADDLSFYAFEGVKAAHNGELHITSSRFDEPRCVALVESAWCVIAVHGEGSDEDVVYLGGLDGATGARIHAALSDRGFMVRSHSNPSLQGRDPSNICNRGRSGRGVQLEIARGLRNTLFAGLHETGRTRHTARFQDLVGALRGAVIS